MPSWTEEDRAFMRLALELAAKGRGRVEPNPMVGCVIVRNRRIVSHGYHHRFGGPHAERDALRGLGDIARGATAYVTLEPCNHTGKTPPCTDALIKARIGRVVVAMKDPNPLVAGRGLRRLRAGGIRVDAGLMREESQALNAPFIVYHKLQRPYVILKWAQSIDGKIATRTGDSQWITSVQSRRAGHAIRARSDAVIVGVGTIIADDPDLTARLVKPKRIAARVVLDPTLRTPPAARVVKTAKQTPTILVAARPASAAARRKAAMLERAGCEILHIRAGRSGIILEHLLSCLHARGMTNLMVEGGGKTLGAFVEAGFTDEAFIFVAPRLIGGETAPGPLRHLGPKRMSEILNPHQVEIAHHGPDICYNLRFRP